jgi:hypothetical protein
MDKYLPINKYLIQIIQRYTLPELKNIEYNKIICLDDLWYSTYYIWVHIYNNERIDNLKYRHDKKSWELSLV